MAAQLAHAHYALADFSGGALLCHLHACATRPLLVDGTKESGSPGSIIIPYWLCSGIPFQ